MKTFPWLFGGVSLVCAQLLLTQTANAQVTVTILKVFGDGSTPNDALQPEGGVIQATDGALYGTGYTGGANGVGAVFKMNTDGSDYTIPYYFKNDYVDGQHPTAGLVQGSDGALYGTTFSGGVNNAGVVFKVSTNGMGYTLLHTFGTVASDGLNPYAGLIQAADGFLYGTTTAGGISNFGTVFKLSVDGSAYATIHNFSGGTDGRNPYAALLQASDGALYGTTFDANEPPPYPATVFRIRPSDLNYQVIHVFSDQSGSAYGPLIQGTDGLLYNACSWPNIYRLDTSGSNYVTFGLGDSISSDAALVQGTDGALYGTSEFWHELFKINPDGSQFASLYADNSSPFGISPQSGLIQARDGAFYGTAAKGGAGAGILFQMSKPSPPVILTQPSGLTNDSCTLVTFSVTHAGTLPMAFQWYQNDLPLTNSMVVRGTDTDTLYLSPPVASAVYTVVLTNALGSVTSAPTVLSVTPGPCSGTLVLAPGWNLIANQLNNPNGNTLNNILLSNVNPALPDGCQFFKFLNNVTNVSPWVGAIYSQAMGSWTPNGVTLDPGDGAFFLNPSTSSLTVQLTGTGLPPRSTPFAFTSAAIALLSDQANEPSTYDLIVGAPPQWNTTVYQWNGSNYNGFSYAKNKSSGALFWAPATPAVPHGQSVWIVPPFFVIGQPPAPPVFLSIYLTNGAANLQWNGVPLPQGYPYLLQSSTDLVKWSALTNASSPLLIYPTNSPQMFYRVQSL